MKKILILSLLAPVLALGQSMKVQRMNVDSIHAKGQYALFRIQMDSVYTNAINKDRAKVGKRPMVNDPSLNAHALDRALRYAKYVVENSKCDSCMKKAYNLEGAHDGSIGAENVQADISAAGYRLNYDLSKISPLEIRDKFYSLVVPPSSSTQDEVKVLSVYDFYQFSKGHLDTRRNTGGGWERFDWKKYGYAVVVVIVEGPNLAYDPENPGICMPRCIQKFMISYEVFSK